MKKNRSLIPNQDRKAAEVPQQAQSQPPEMLLLQFGDHVRNISKSLSAMGDIATIIYNENMGLRVRTHELEAEVAKLKVGAK